MLHIILYVEPLGQAQCLGCNIYYIKTQNYDDNNNNILKIMVIEF